MFYNDATQGTITWRSRSPAISPRRLDAVTATAMAASKRLAGGKS